MEDLYLIIHIDSNCDKLGCIRVGQSYTFTHVSLFASLVLREERPPVSLRRPLGFPDFKKRFEKEALCAYCIG